MTNVDLTRTLELVRQAQSGDRDALDRLFSRYYDRVLRIVRVRLGKKLRRDFESGDILQDSFATAVRKFEDFEMRDEASFIAWLRVIVEHQITDRVDWQSAASRDRRREVPIGGAGAEPASERDGTAASIEPPALQTAPLDALVRREGQQLVETYLSRIEPNYRDLILLRDYEGHSWDRIAEMTGRPSPDAARMMYAKALVELGMHIRRGRAGDGPT